MSKTNCRCCGLENCICTYCKHTGSLGLEVSLDVTEDVIELKAALASMTESRDRNAEWLKKAEAERDEARAILRSFRAEVDKADTVYMKEIEKLQRDADIARSGHEGQTRNTLAFMDDLEKMTAERDAIKAELADSRDAFRALDLDHAKAGKVYTDEIKSLMQERDNWKSSHAGQQRNTGAFYYDCEKLKATCVEQCSRCAVESGGHCDCDIAATESIRALAAKQKEPTR